MKEFIVKYTKTFTADFAEESKPEATENKDYIHDEEDKEKNSSDESDIQRLNDYTKNLKEE
jgi:hypothetical protein